MKFVAEIQIMPHKELLDPQGKAVSNNLKNIDIHSVADVRIGKHILLTLEAGDEAGAKDIVEKACSRLLANPIMETFQYRIVPA